MKPVRNVPDDHFSKQSFWALKGTILLFAGLALLLAGCGKKEEPPVKEVVRPVKILTIASSGGGAGLTFPGEARASKRVDLAFQVAGPLTQLPVDEGQEVKKGALIARILPRDFITNLEKAKAQALEAEQQYTRYKDLYIRKQVSKAEFDRYRSSRDVARAQQKAAQDALNDTYLKAPYSGVIAVRYVENFQEIQAKQPIVSLQDISQIEILINVPETVMATLRAGERPEVFARFDTAPGQQFPLTLKEFSTQADPQTQTYQVVLLMPQPDTVHILPGMTATVWASRKGVKDEPIIIPAVAVMEDAGGNSYVWIFNQKDEIVQKRKVTVGQMTGSENINILDGLLGDEKIVTAGLTKLREGMKVRVWAE
jgi:RND family efflux transporter MFP subunit